MGEAQKVLSCFAQQRISNGRASQGHSASCLSKFLRSPYLSLTLKGEAEWWVLHPLLLAADGETSPKFFCQKILVGPQGLEPWTKRL